MSEMVATAQVEGYRVSVDTRWRSVRRLPGEGGYDAVIVAGLLRARIVDEDEVEEHGGRARQEAGAPLGSFPVGQHVLGGPPGSRALGRVTLGG